MPVAQPDPKEMSILFDLWLITHSLSGLLDSALEDANLSGDEFGLYSLLRVFGPASPTEISQWTGMGATTISTTLKRLSMRGHTKQQVNPLDRRSYRVALSSSGIKAHASTAKAFLEVAKLVSEALGSEEQHQRLSLQRLDSTIRKVASLDDRPYTVTSKTNSRRETLSYDGNPLTPKQEQSVLQYMDFLRSSDNNH